MFLHRLYFNRAISDRGPCRNSPLQPENIRLFLPGMLILRPCWLLPPLRPGVLPKQAKTRTNLVLGLGRISCV